MSVILELVNLGPLSCFDHVMGTRTYELYLTTYARLLLVSLCCSRILDRSIPICSSTVTQFNLAAYTNLPWHWLCHPEISGGIMVDSTPFKDLQSSQLPSTPKSDGL